MRMLRTNSLSVSTLFFLILAVMIFIPLFSFGYDIEKPDSVIFIEHDCCGQENVTVIQVAESDLSVGMTKLEVYEVKGTPYRVNRLAGESNREQWVYRCMNSEGYEEDCLHLYFEDDKLVKIKYL